MQNIENASIQGAFAAFVAMISYYCGIVTVPLIVLAVVMIIDYITGMASAWKSKKLSSKKGVLGIVKKLCYLALVCVGMGVDWLIYSGLRQVGVILDYTIFFGVLVTVWLIINELISILENLKNVGVPLPKFLLSVVKRLKISADNAADNAIAKEENERNESNEKGN